MTNGSRDEFFWKEWQNILLTEFEGRMAAVGVKGQWMAPASKTLTVLFLQTKGFSIPAADILPEIIRTMREKDTVQPDSSSFGKEYDAMAMIGHRIGMVDNSALLKQYLQDVHTALKPEGQILLTSLDIHAFSESEHRVNQILRNKKFQQANLIGPFFNVWHTKADTLKSQATGANWQCEWIYRQDDSNYFARLSLAESGFSN